ncbi:pirin family protein [Marinicauda algicola]|uniref:Pirin family protein n=1 Tax=Marinicauda algicola TaxID=2029849 RepID=A0A4S2GZ85_9PROT|nr:pirin family protein [Marinicauda algicola]TGY88251.1 pirin family protein [Marinicauda algicola]
MAQPALERIIDGRKKDLGGFEVARVLPHAKRRLVGPFIFFDEMGPARFAPGKGIDVRPHPHIGLATVTYLFEGEMDHADSLGVFQTIYPGDVNLMTAGRGIVHSERTGITARQAGHALHGIQTWLALPEEAEETDPAFVHHGRDDLPNFKMDAVSMRLILGTAYGHRSPVEVHSPTVYIHAEAEAGARFDLPEGHEELAVYVVNGEIELSGESVKAGQMGVLAEAGPAPVAARTASRIMVLGGAALGPRFIEWNFVATRQDRIEQAKADWRESIANGFTNTRFSQARGEHEYIPLPGDSQAGEPPRPSKDCPTT